MENDEEREFNWGNFAGKAIVAVAIVLVVVWCLFLANKGIKSSLGVLTNNIFAENIDRMKEVGKSYFTNERLPQKIGEVKTLSLAKMYDEKLILKVNDKNGHACSANNSYVSVEKYNEYEYHMKIYLECGEESDHILVILGCYDYCKDKVCEKDDSKTPVAQELEYEYVKTKGGYWTDYGKWSEWSKVAVTETDYRDVETKEEKERYSYDKTVVEKIYTSYKTSCPEGYSKSSDGKRCYKVVKDTIYVEGNKCPNTYNGYEFVNQDGLNCKYTKEIVDYKEPNKCSSTQNGYTLESQDGFNCIYSKKEYDEVKPNKCPSTYNGMKLESQNGFTCNYKKIVTDEKNPVCPNATDGFTLESQNGFTCNYSKSVEYTKDPVCPESYEGLNYSGRNGFTCNYSKTYQVNCKKDVIKTEQIIKCTESGCRPFTQVTYGPMKCETLTNRSTTTATCPSGTYRSGNICVGYNNSNKKLNAVCPNGYNSNNGICIKTWPETATSVASCPSGYTRKDNKCKKEDTTIITKEASCPNGYDKSGNSCVKTNNDNINIETTCPSGYTPSKDKKNCYKNTEETLFKDLNKYCPSGYKDSGNDYGCYKEEEKTEHVDEDRIVKYYRYRLREYKGQTVIDYKWSSSNNDRELINNGYRLTGKTRVKGGK